MTTEHSACVREAAPPTEDPLQAVEALLKQHYFEPDMQAIRIVLGTAKAHYLDVGDPAWLFVVAPPGSGKSTISIMAASGLPSVRSLGDISENTFLSGFYDKQQAGLLEQLGGPPEPDAQDTLVSHGDALFLMKDFTTVLSMRREKRAAILGQLREIHDGSFTRTWGTGETKRWEGHISVIAAVTPELDRKYSIFSTLGERFLQVRWHRPTSPEAGVWAIRQQGKEKEINKALSGAVKTLFESSVQTAPSLPDEFAERIARIAEFAAIARTSVARSSYGNREIEYVPEPESNTRIAKQLASIVKGIAALGARTEANEADLQDAFRVALDGIPPQRRAVLEGAFQEKSENEVKLPKSTRRYAREDLQELGLLSEHPGSLRLSPEASALVEMSELNI